MANSTRTCTESMDQTENLRLMDMHQYMKKQNNNRVLGTLHCRALVKPDTSRDQSSLKRHNLEVAGYSLGWLRRSSTCHIS